MGGLARRGRFHEGVAGGLCVLGPIQAFKGGLLFWGRLGKGAWGCYGFGGIGRWPLLGGLKALRVQGAGLFGLWRNRALAFFGGIKGAEGAGRKPKKSWTS